MRAETVLKQTMNFRVISYNRSDHDRGFVAKMTHDGRLLWASHVHSIGWTGDEGPYDTNGGSTISRTCRGRKQRTHGVGCNRIFPSSDVRHHI